MWNVYYVVFLLQPRMLQSKFRITYHAEVTNPPVLLVGYVSDARVMRIFLQEFYHPDRFQTNTSQYGQFTPVVIMAPHEPSEELQSLLVSPMIDGKARYVKGSVMLDEDLYRAGVDEARACFVLCDKTTTTPESMDAATVLRALMVENFNPDMDLYVQLVCSVNRNHLLQAEADHFIVVNELKMAIVARSFVCPGFCALFSNLFQSTFLSYEDQLTKGEESAGGAAAAAVVVVVSGVAVAVAVAVAIVGCIVVIAH